MRLYPRRPLLIGVATLAGLSLLPVAFASLWAVWQVLLGALLVLALADLMLLAGMRTPRVQRQVHANLALAARQSVRLTLFNPGRSRLLLQVHDHYPPDFRAEGMPARLELAGGGRAKIRYTVQPTQRGDHSFGDVELTVRSLFGFWSQVHRLDCAKQVRVFPNFGEVAHFALLARRNRLSEAGIRRRQRRGSGNDFHQLRDYQTCDSLRQIDWKATGRYRKLISREYQDEQNQQLFFLLDCGQRMRHCDAQGSHMDAALNAMLLASHIANKQGDAVGYMSFAGNDRYLAPRKGAGTVPALLRSLYDLQSGMHAADYLEMAERFLARHLRRALVVVITNTRDGDQEDLLRGVRLLQKRHLVLVADLREARLDQVLEAPLQDHRQAMRFHSAQGLRQSRVQLHDALRHQGVLVLDLLPAQLPPALINEYFEAKRAARL
jgi:uncharacterized protein (DUF58 family)